MRQRVMLRILDSLSGVEPEKWDTLSGGQPFLSHAFFTALADSGCASPRTGWIPCFPSLWEGDDLVGAMPLYLKRHSWGEYVFDWAWAEAYHRRGLDYYPKLVSSVPFTPVSGPRLLASKPEDRSRLLIAALDLSAEIGASGLHCLFPGASEAAEMASQGMMLRTGMQFHWQNKGYADFKDYLSTMSHDKRKKIRQERRRIGEAGISLERKTGRDIGESDWVFFDSCYRNTYSEHRSSPYLNLDFFLKMGETLADNLLMVIAYREGRAIASALDLFDGKRLYGRYWGAMERHSGLHFETCYYQGIEFCIERDIAAFEGGAQGAHKLARGFMPVQTWSAHWLAHPDFSRAVGAFLDKESTGMAQHIAELEEAGPFRGS